MKKIKPYLKDFFHHRGTENESFTEGYGSVHKVNKELVSESINVFTEKNSVFIGSAKEPSAHSVHSSITGVITFNLREHAASMYKKQVKKSKTK